MHASFLLHATPQQTDVQELNAGKPQGQTPAFQTLTQHGEHSQLYATTSQNTDYDDSFTER
jgi:hypothetical protein